MEVILFFLCLSLILFNMYRLIRNAFPIRKINVYLILEVFLVFIGCVYYLFFVNKGLVLFDEGYYVHSAERIYDGQIPYKDFSLQYSPGYFYLLAFLYKLFGPSILVGRYLSVSICVLIIIFSFILLNKLKVKSFNVILLSFLGIISFGYPLINIPTPIWAIILFAIMGSLAYLYWLSSNNRSKHIYFFIIGLLLSTCLFFRQNLGISFVLIFNILILITKEVKVKEKLISVLILNITWIVLTFLWIYHFFLRYGTGELIKFLDFSKRFATEFQFTYPPISYIFQPLGIIKLLPYYLPIFFLLLVLILFFKKLKTFRILSLFLVFLVGFFTYIYPNSELLHVYPFWGMLLVSLTILSERFKRKWIFNVTICVMICIGFYLTLFREYYRYSLPYKNYTVISQIPRLKGILLDKETSRGLDNIAHFINLKTSKKEYIFVYPYSPMLYFILERPNPSKDPIYSHPLWHQYTDKEILHEVKMKKTKYIITSGDYAFDADISQFILKQHEIFKSGFFKIFEII